MAPAAVIPYAPRRTFLPFHLRQQRYAVIVAHRRAGKTVACVNDIIKRAIELDKPRGRYGYIAPLLKQAKKVAWEYLKEFARPAIRSVNESELWVEVAGGARVGIYGADNPDGIRGEYFDGVVLDEVADMRESVWGQIVRPMLADRQGWAVFIGTPKGRGNDFYGKYEHAVMNPARWFSALYRASETGILPAEELEEAQRDMTPEEYEQEFECSFDAAIRGAYYGKEMAALMSAGHFVELEPVPGVPVHTAWDLGIGDSTAIWFWQAVGSELRVVDYYENHGQALPHYASEIDARGYLRGEDYVPHDAAIRELSSGKSRIETLIALGCKPKLMPAAKIADSINAVRLTLPLTWFDRNRTKEGAEALRQYRTDYDDKLRTFRDTPLHNWASHGADAAAIMCRAWREQARIDVEKPRADPKNMHEMTYDQLHSVLKRHKGGVRV